MEPRVLALRQAAVCLLAAGGLAVAGCGDDDAGERPVFGNPEPTPRTEPPERVPPPYRPGPAEAYPDGKRIAAMFAQRALTYPRGSTPTDVARAVGGARVAVSGLAATIAPAVDPDSASTAEVIYPQLSGVTPTTLGAMVIVRQTLEPEGSDPRSVERVLDVRLTLNGRGWELEQIGDVGGSEVSRPEALSPAAERVLDDPGIEMSDSARWDVYRGGVDDGLLEALADAGRTHDFAVGILSSGHPANVWATTRRSAHSFGFAADIYKVDGRLVIDQREVGTPAYELAASLARSATQLGSPWVFGPGSFSDAVHQDHLHLQSSPTA